MGFGDCPSAGLSPRGRGNPKFTDSKAFYLGSIPAWAGEPISLLITDWTSPVYPRVGGGTLPAFSKRIRATGLSPRGRGNPAAAAEGKSWLRSIPAWVGEP